MDQASVAAQVTEVLCQTPSAAEVSKVPSSTSQEPISAVVPASSSCTAFSSSSPLTEVRESGLATCPIGNIGDIPSPDQQHGSNAPHQLTPQAQTREAALVPSVRPLAAQQDIVVPVQPNSPSTSVEQPTAASTPVGFERPDGKVVVPNYAVSCSAMWFIG